MKFLRSDPAFKFIAPCSKIKVSNPATICYSFKKTITTTTKLRSVSFLAGTVNTSVNPILMSVFNLFFRDDLASFLRVFCCRTSNRAGLARTPHRRAAEAVAGLSVTRVFPSQQDGSSRSSDNGCFLVVRVLDSSSASSSEPRGGLLLNGRASADTKFGGHLDSVVK